MSPDILRSAIEATLRQRDPQTTVDVRRMWDGSGLATASAPPAQRCAWARERDESGALRDLAILVGLRVTDCPSCGGRGRRAYGREVEDGCDECECAGIVVTDPAADLDAVRAELARVTAERDDLADESDVADDLWSILGGSEDDEARGVDLRSLAEFVKYRADNLARVTAERDALRDAAREMLDTLTAYRATTRRGGTAQEYDALGTRAEASETALRALVEATAGESGGERE